MTQQERKARQALRQHGQATYYGYELWATYNTRGEYPGHFRMAPTGVREHYRDYELYTATLKAAFRFLNRLPKE